MNKNYIFGIITVLFIVVGVIGLWFFTNQTNVTVSVTKIGTIPEGSQVLGFYVSPDLSSFAYRTKNGDKFSAVYDGKTSKYFDNVYDFVFSPDSKQFAYTAEEGGKMQVVLNGKEGKLYDVVSRPVFGSTGNLPYFDLSGNFFYKGTVGNKQFIVIDGNEVKSWELFLNQTPSPDGNGFAYKFKSGKGWIVNYTTKNSAGEYVGYDGKEYFDVSFFKWSPDGKHFVYKAFDYDGKSIMIVDGKEEKPYGLINEFKWSSSGKSYAYVGQFDTGGMVAVLNGEEVGDKYTLVTGITLSLDGEQLAYRGYYKDVGVDVIVNGKKIAQYNQVSGIVFSPNGAQIAYFAVEDGKKIVVKNGEIIGRYDMWYGVGPLSFFSIDGEHFAYTASEDDKFFVVLDGKEGDKYDSVYISEGSFNEDEKTFSYLAISKSDILRVVNSL